MSTSASSDPHQNKTLANDFITARTAIEWPPTRYNAACQVPQQEHQLWVLAMQCLESAIASSCIGHHTVHTPRFLEHFVVRLLPDMLNRQLLSVDRILQLNRILGVRYFAVTARTWAEWVLAKDLPPHHSRRLFVDLIEHAAASSSSVELLLVVKSRHNNDAADGHRRRRIATLL